MRRGGVKKVGGDNMNRKLITGNVIEQIFTEEKAYLIGRLKQKGYHVLVSSHEMLGIITEEYHELVNTIMKNNLSEINKELSDLVVACLLARISIRTGGQDWL